MKAKIVVLSAIACIVVAGPAFGALILSGSSTITFPNGSVQSTAFQGASMVGKNNTAVGTYAVVGGGYNNTAGGYASTVSGGKYNAASGSYSAIGGGRYNSAVTVGDTIGGGSNNTTGYGGVGYNNTIGGGFYNYAGGGSYGYATVAGGAVNNASGDWSAIGGGLENTASGDFSTVPGGLGNTASGDFSFAAGRSALANQQGSFVWADSYAGPMAAAAQDTFNVFANGGVWFGQPPVPAYIRQGNFIDTSTGGYLTLAGVWGPPCDVERKEDFQPIDAKDILERLAQVPVQNWRFKIEEGDVRHMGPTAQDFSAAFGLGKSDKNILTTDADGVAMAAIQGLNQVVQEKDAEIAALKDRLASMEDAMWRMIAAQIAR